MAGYQTSIFGKWHLGEGDEHCPTGFDDWSVVPGQGDYWDPEFLENSPNNTIKEYGYAVDIVTDKAIDWLNHRNQSQPYVHTP